MRKTLALMLLLSVLTSVVSLAVGSSGYLGLKSFLRVVTGNASPVDESIVIGYRLPRLLLSILVGISLSASGCAMQSLFRNPLAEPYVLGVASGASVGAALVITLGLGSIQNIVLAAFLSSLLTISMVYKIGTLARFRDQNYAILLAGIAIASFLSGLTSLLIYLHAQSMHKVVFWLMGSFSNPQWSEVYFVVLPVIVGVSFLLANSWKLNALLLGDEHAMAVGVNVERFRKHLIAVVSLLTASAVSVSGVIGFVGIIVPHTMRLIVGEEHGKLLPATILFSTIFMPTVDVVARISTSGELPIGAITAMIGGPFFLYLLWRR